MVRSALSKFHPSDGNEATYILDTVDSTLYFAYCTPHTARAHVAYCGHHTLSAVNVCQKNKLQVQNVQRMERKRKREAIAPAAAPLEKETGNKKVKNNMKHGSQK